MKDVQEHIAKVKPDYKSKLENVNEHIEETNDGEEQISWENKNIAIKFCYVVVCSPLFNIVIMSLIIWNTYILAKHHHDQSPEEISYDE